MKNKVLFFVLVLVLLSASTLNASAQEITADMDSSFLYQGVLKNDAGEPITAVCDFMFRLYGVASGGSQVGASDTITDVTVTDGVFTAQVNDRAEFGSAPFNGQTRWLDISVRCPAGSGGYTTLSPRQPITAAPMANYASVVPWSGINHIPAGFADGVDNDTDTTYSAGDGLTLSGTEFSIQFAGSGTSDFAAHSDHNHFGQSWSDTSGAGLTISGGEFGVISSGSNAGVMGTSSIVNGRGLYGAAYATTGANYGVYGSSLSNAGTGVYGRNNASVGSEAYGVYGITESAFGAGVFGYALTDGHLNYGVRGKSDSAHGVGVFGESANIGVYGLSTEGIGVQGTSEDPDGYAIFGVTTATGAGEAYGVRGISTTDEGAGVYGKGTQFGVKGYTTGASGTVIGVQGWATTSADGVGVYGQGSSKGVSGYATYGAGVSALTGSGTAVLAQVQSTSAEVILGKMNNSTIFIVDGNGNVKADGTYTSPAADYADLLPAVDGLLPGDVLVIGSDGKLTRSTTPYQSSLAGVYSTQPAFMGGEDPSADGVTRVPLALVGVVPVCVTDENGPIQPGDLLTTSSTPGCAMKAAPISFNGITFYAPGTTIGKALDPHQSGTGSIRILVTRQ